MKWTVEQEKAIYEDKCNLLVSAGAGSGKTAVLVERILNKVLNKDVDITNLLIVTFTNAAASEMKERILNKLYEKLENDNDNIRLQEQIININKANIMTIHSFCLSVIREYYFKINLDPNFNITNEIDNELMKYNILEEMFEEIYEQEQIDSDFLDVCQMYDNTNDLNELKNLIINIYKYIQNMPFPDMYVNILIEEISNNNLDDFEKTPIAIFAVNNINIKMKKINNLLNEILDIVSEYDKQLEYFLQYKEQFNNIIIKTDSINNINWNDLKKLMCNVSFLRRPSTRGMEDISNLIDDKWKSIKLIFNDILIELDKEKIKQQNNINKKQLVYLLKLVLKFKNKFAQEKLKNNVLDFNDLEHFALKILVEIDDKNNIKASDVAKEYRLKFNEILIDEYQDSNYIQEYILNIISKCEENDPNVFMVGDVKQSIYKFRGAKPEIFLKKYYEYGDEGKYKKINLYKNFRSREEILNFTNYIFSNIMSKQLGDIEYNETEYLNAGFEYSNIEENNSKVEIDIIQMQDNSETIQEESEEDNKEIDVQNIEYEVKYTINKIQELIENRYMVYDKKIDDYRPIKYSDIVILLRKTKNISEIYNELFKQNNIPIFIDNVSGYLDELEVENVISFLQVIDNPYQDIPLISVLKSPFGNFNDNELIKIRMYDKNGYYYTAMQKISINNSDELSKKVNKFIFKLNEYSEKAKYQTVSNLIWDIYEENNYIAYMKKYKQYESKRANLMLLLDRAKQFESLSYKGLFNFINFIQKIKDNNQDLGSATILGENDNVVRLLSIHKSKGLEFPVVFLSNINSKFNYNDLKQKILLHQDLGIGYEVIDLERRVHYPSIYKKIIRQKMINETIAEEMRILYVGITRAKEKLYLTGISKNIDKDIGNLSNIEILTSYMKLILTCLNTKKYNKDEIELKYINCSDIPMNKINYENEEENILLKQNEDINMDKYKLIDKDLKYEYKFIDSISIPHKLSVSQIKKTYNESDEFIDLYGNNLIKKDISFLEDNTILKPTELGTIYHRIFEKIKYNKKYTIEELKKVLEEFVKNNILNEDELKQIKISEIFNFLNSNIYSRIINSSKVYKEQQFIWQPRIKELGDLIEYKNTEDETILIQGVIDLFFIENDEIILIDYKTDKNINNIKEKYVVQMDLYKLAMEKLLGKKVKERYIYLTKTSKFIKI